MAVEVVQNNNSGRISYTKAAAIGAIGGYALKWAIPITTQEKDKRYNATLIKIKNINLDEVDVFVRLQDNKLSSSKIKEINKILLSEIKNSVKITKKVAEKFLVAFTKSIRPTKTFVSVGVGLTVGATVIHNIFYQIAKDWQKD